MINIYVNRLDGSLSNAQLAAIKQALDTLEANLPFLIALTPEERMKLPKLGAGNKPFTDDVRMLFKAGSNFFPPFIDATAFEKDLLLYEQLDNFKARLETLSRKVNDTQMLAGHEALIASLRYYETAKSGVLSGAPGAQSAVDRLSERFDGQGNFNEAEEETPPAA